MSDQDNTLTLQSLSDVWEKPSHEKIDPLLRCLEMMAELTDHKTSAAAFLSSLPVFDVMTPDLFIRSARNNGFRATSMKREIKDINALILPCVLVLKDGKACVITEEKDSEHVHILLPEIGMGEQVISKNDLEELYEGHLLLMKPEYRYDARSPDLDVQKSQNWFWGVLWHFRPLYAKVALAAIMVNVFALATPLYTMNIYDRVVPNNAFETLFVLTLGVGIIFLFDFLLKMMRVYFVDTAGKSADVLMASRLLSHVMNIRHDQKPTSSGSFANQLREFETLRDLFSSATFVALIDLPFVFLFIGVVYWIGGPVAFVPAIAIPLAIIASVLIYRPLDHWVRRSFRESAQKHALLVEAIHGLETLKCFGAQGRILKSWEKYVDQAANSSRFLRFFSSLALNITGFIQQATYVLIIVVGVYLISKGELSMGGLIACSILGSRTMAPLSQVVALLTRMNQSRASLEGLDAIMKLPSERPQDKVFLHRPQIKGHLTFKDVTFHYPDAPVPALKDVSFSIAPGERVGILGRIGSGKSTIEKLILNLYEPDSGSICLDETDIKQMDPAELRHQIGYVPQETFLFYGSVRENITFGLKGVRDEALIQAAHYSGAMHFIQQHPKGFDMPVGEGGQNLSGGQRQAIAIARALIRQPRLFIMDEPTAMMDQMSETLFLKHFEPCIQDRTLLIVTHKMPLVRFVDRLIILDDGRKVADGPRDEVLKALNQSQVTRSQEEA